MTIQYEPIETHLTHSRGLIRQAEAELEKGDRLRASEKTWGLSRITSSSLRNGGDGDTGLTLTLSPLQSVWLLRQRMRRGWKPCSG